MVMLDPFQGVLLSIEVESDSFYDKISEIIIDN